MHCKRELIALLWLTAALGVVRAQVASPPPASSPALGPLVSSGELSTATGPITFTAQYWEHGAPEDDGLAGDLLRQLNQIGTVNTFDGWADLHTKASLPRLLKYREVSERGMEQRRAGLEETRYSGFQILLVVRAGPPENEMIIAATRLTLELWRKDERGQLTKVQLERTPALPMTYVFRMEDGKYKIDRNQDEHPLVKVVDLGRWSELHLPDAQNWKKR